MCFALDLLCFLSLIAFSLVVILSLIAYFEQKDKEAARLTYRQFREYFTIAANKWSIRNEWTICHGEWPNFIPVTFNYVDYLRARFDIWNFQRKVQKDLNANRQNENAVKLARAVQHDIDVMQTKSNIELTHAKNIIEDIRKGIKQL